MPFYPQKIIPKNNFKFLYLFPHKTKAIVMNKIYQAFSLFVSAALIVACSGPAEQKSEESVNAETETESTADDSYEAPSEASFKFDLIIANNVAAPVKLLTDMNDAGLENYREEITNPTDKLANYSTANEKALAFGVYGADLSYNSLHDQYEKMADYLFVIRKLSEDLGLTYLFDQETIEHFEHIKTNPDSVKFFIFDKYDSADEYLRSNERLMTATMILTGGLIESLHLVSSQIETGEISKEAYMIFLGQKNSLKSVLDLYETMESEGQEIAIKDDVKLLYDKFVEVDSFEMFSKDNIAGLHETITEVRNRMVG